MIERKIIRRGIEILRQIEKKDNLLKLIIIEKNYLQ